MKTLWGTLLLVLSVVLSGIILTDGAALVLGGAGLTLSQHVADTLALIVGPLLFTHAACVVGGMLCTHFGDGPRTESPRFRWGVRLFGSMYVLMLVGLTETAVYLLWGMSLPVSQAIVSLFSQDADVLTVTHLSAVAGGMVATQYTGFRMVPAGTQSRKTGSTLPHD